MTGTAVRLRLNGETRSIQAVEPLERLLDTLRWRLGLFGTKEGCRSGGCGACTVLVDGRPTLSCLALSQDLEDAEVTTVEGLPNDPVGRRVQAAFVEHAGLQCGYCTPGFVVALTGLLKERPGASHAELLADLQGNLCRCTGYASIERAVTALAEDRP